MMISHIEIIIIDDNFDENEPLAVLLREEFTVVKIFANSNEAKNYIVENLTKRFIILLDLQFPNKELSGEELLSKIREFTENIPVIIYTAFASQKTWQEYLTFIDKKIFAFFDKGRCDAQEVVEKVKQAAALLEAQIGTALEEWINLHEENRKEKPYLISKDGQQYTLNQILHEIRMQTEFGKEMEKNIAMLTIDLLARNKEHL